MTVVLVATDQESSAEVRAQQWVDELEARGHDVYLVAPSQTGVRAVHHVVAQGGTADTVRAIADAMEGVPAPVLLLEATAVGSVLTVEEVAAGVGTNVLSGALADTADAGAASAAAPLRVTAGVVVGAGSAVHTISQPTDGGAGLMRVDGADADAVAGALRVMADVASGQQWRGAAWPLTVVAAVRAGVTVRTVQAPGFPWGQECEAPDFDEEVGVRIRAAAGAPQGLVDGVVGRSAAEAVAARAWRLGVGAHAATVVSLATALMAGLLISTGTRTGAAVAALFLLLSVLLDRVDGILARARRTVTTFGAWLDVATDRLREAALVIGLALGAAQAGTSRWALAAAVLAVLTIAHLAADASRSARGWGGSPVPIRIPLDRLDEPELPTLPPPAGRPLPRWLPFSVSRGDGAALVVVGLLALQPPPLLAVLAALAGLSALGCLLLVGAPRPLAAAQRELFEQADPGPLARLVSRQDPQLSVLRRALTTRGAAWIPPSTWALETSVALAAAAVVAPDALPITIAWVGVLAFHRIDIATRQRVLGASPPTWLGVIGLGALGRSTLVLVLAALGVLSEGLALGAVFLGVVYAAESSGRFADR